jgi:hypothetical protein
MKRASYSICSICFILAAGCASAPEYRRDGATAEQRARDLSECDLEVQKSDAGTCEQREVLTRCMAARGYSPVPGTGSYGAFCP